MSSSDPAAARVERRLAAIEAYNDRLKALITVDAAGARLQARTQDGQIVAVKDNIDVAGLRSTAGSRFFADRIAAEDAACVARLRAAGGIVIGKANLHEFAFGGTSQNPHHGACRNPWDPQAIPGGSSGGSGAAAAAGLCDAALGTDTGGSVRVPAALNGLVGLRPTPGRISNRGVFPVSPRFDTVGPMAPTAEAAAALYRAVAGFDGGDPHSIDRPVEVWSGGEPLSGARIGLPSSGFFEQSDAEVVEAVHDATAVFAALGARAAPIAVEGASRVHDLMACVIRADAALIHRERLQSQPALFGADVLERLRLGQATSPDAYAAGLAACVRWRAHVAALLQDVDFILTPTVGTTAPPILAAGDVVRRTHDLTRMTFVWSFSETPAISIPCGFSAAGLPIGVQLIAAPWAEARLLAVAAAFQAVTDHHLRRPALGARHVR